MKKRISRRQFISNSAATSAALGVIANQTAQSAPTPAVSMTNPGTGAWVRWLDGNSGAVAQGVTWGTPWPRGKQREGKNFALRGADQKLQPLQSWPLAYWPDGSTQVERACACRRATHQPTDRSKSLRGRTPQSRLNVSVKETDGAIEVDTGQFVCRFARQGSNIIDSITRGGREALRDGRLVLLRQDRAASADDAQVRQEKFEGLIDESHRRAARPGSRGSQARRQTFQRQRAAGCRSRCAFTSTPAAMPCACCTPSCSMATSRRISSAALACAFQRR